MAAERTLEFIEDYREKQVLWDHLYPGYSDKAKREAAYYQMGGKYGLTVREVKNKIKSLRSYFAKELSKIRERRSRASPGEAVESSWFAFLPMMFLAESVTQRNDTLMKTLRTNIVRWDELRGNPEDGDSSEDENGHLSSNEDGIISISLNDSEDSRLATSSHSLGRISDETKLGRRTKRKHEDDSSEENASNSLKNSYINELAIFAHLLRIQLSKLSRLNQAIVKNKINNFLFDLEMDELNNAGEGGKDSKREVYSEERCLESLQSVEDEMLLFAQMIQIQISRFSRRNQMVARNEINNLVHDIEMEELKKVFQPEESTLIITTVEKASEQSSPNQTATNGSELEIP